MADDMININVIVADRPYPLKIKREEEESIRNAARTINEKVKEFQQVYAAKDKQDYLAMTALMYAVESLSQKKNTIITDKTFEEKLEQLEQLMNTSI